MARKTSQAGIDLIKRFEGCRLKAYKPVPTEKYWTIGYGHYGPDVTEGMTITLAQAEDLLRKDIPESEVFVNSKKYVPVTSQLTQNQFDVLVSFVYNCGQENLKSLCKDRTIAQIGQAIIKYNKAGGKVLGGLVTRRAAEQALFNKPDAKPIPKEESMYNPFKDYDKLTSPFGMRIHPVHKTRKFHKGVDLVISPSNGEIKAFVGGEVLHAKEGATGSGFGNYGITVAIKDDKGYLHVYAHLSSVSVKVGQKVVQGQVVGRQGSTGISSGPHLHYEVRKASTPSFGYTTTEDGVVEPTQYLKSYYATEQKEEEPMTKEEKALFDALTKRVTDLEKIHNMDCPEWAKEAVETARKIKYQGKPLIDTVDGGSYDVYRLITILYRLGKFKQS
ncbi:Murein DD-endopeptidase MepM [compost metagenome]